MPSTERTDEHGIVVVDVDGQDIGMVVDAVTEVSRIPSDSIEPPSSVITTDDSEYLTGIVKTDDKLIILLDIAKVISESEASALEEIQQSPDTVAA
jgi:purine-binding chemotaxis protein CheW